MCELCSTPGCIDPLFLADFLLWIHMHIVRILNRDKASEQTLHKGSWEWDHCSKPWMIYCKFPFAFLWVLTIAGEYSKWFIWEVLKLQPVSSGISLPSGRHSNADAYTARTWLSMLILRYTSLAVAFRMDMMQWNDLVMTLLCRCNLRAVPADSHIAILIVSTIMTSPSVKFCKANAQHIVKRESVAFLLCHWGAQGIINSDLKRERERFLVPSSLHTCASITISSYLSTCG